MDGLKVTLTDKLKYRVIQFLREYFREENVGHLLRAGALPASITTNNAVVTRFSLPHLAPYEVFAMDRLYVNEGSIGICFQLTTESKASPELVAFWVDALINQIPDNVFVQVSTFKLGGEPHQSHTLLSFSVESGSNASISEPVAVLDEIYGLVQVHMAGKGCQVEIVEPQKLLTLVHGLFGRGGPRHYQDTMLIRTQCPDVRLQEDLATATLSDAAGEVCQLRFYTARRFGFWEPSNAANLYPALMRLDRFLFAAHYVRKDGVIQGESLFVSYPVAGDEDGARDLFLGCGWLLEEDSCYRPLRLIDVLPLGFGPTIFPYLVQRRRVRHLGADQLRSMLPLPYLANTPANGLAPIGVLSRPTQSAEA